MTLLGAIEGGGTKFVCGIGTPEGEIIESISFPTTTPEETLGKAMNYFDNKGIQAIGIGTFGPIDVNSKSPTFGTVGKTPKPYWSGFPVIEYVKRHIDIPFGFDTDVNAAAVGEATWGAAKGLDNSLYMTIGTGIGVGAIVDGKLVHGLSHPEMGHILIRRHPEDSYAGHCPFHQDCLEGLACGPAIEARWSMKAYELNELHPAWQMESYYIAQALVNYILVLSPEKMILGGGVMNQLHLFPMLRDQVASLLNGYLQHPASSGTEENFIVQPALGEKAGLTGALALAMSALSQNE
ncbi:ROK family protein [Paenibacillus sp. PL91]|uniref:ROK family protein n=1 Tax=Paenibacillus sp. PL91 TaxID=2729538 RepID=UPI00145E8B5D|nr:ROK family protein [Paenibacillus sp. PL91]MBC9201084.1 ROK family protein [Paenibacillus sp. PL91]